MRQAQTHALIVVLLYCACAMGLDTSLDVSQYAHRSWTVRDGFAAGAIFAMAQTPDGYLWLASEFGMFRFDGVKANAWEPPAGQKLPEHPYALLVTRDGTLWIGTFAGLVSWDGKTLTEYPELSGSFVTSLLEDREGTVWVATLFGHGGRLCGIRQRQVQCYGEDGSFGSFVWSLYEDSSGVLWAGAESGVWRFRPGPPKRYPTSARVGDLLGGDHGTLLFGIRGAGLKQLIREKVETYPIRIPGRSSGLVADAEVDSNKLLRDRDGGLWIGTENKGLIHIHHGRTDLFTKSDGLSGDIICTLFEDREGNLWVATVGGLDKFRELPVTNISTKQGLASDRVWSLVATRDGSVWMATAEGLDRWKDGEFKLFPMLSRRPEDVPQSLFADSDGRVWASTPRGLVLAKDGSFGPPISIPSTQVYSIAGDEKGNLWLSGNKGLSHLLNQRLVEHFPWSVMGREQQAKVIVLDPDRGGLWLAFWKDGGVLYFKDGRVQESYTESSGLAEGAVAGLQMDRERALWAATEEGGLSRIKDGRVSSLTTKNGLPCDTIHWSIEDNDRSLWLDTACGLVRITRPEVDAWIANPNHKVSLTVWGALDGVRPQATSPAYFNPPVAQSADGKLWFQPGEALAVVDPQHFPVNKIPPPVHIERITADDKVFWENLPGSLLANLRLPARTRDVTIDYAALSLVSPQKVHFKYKLEGQDTDWREVVNDRQVQYSNLSPGTYRFHVIASNNSGVWNEQGDTLEFSIAPAYYQTNWFRVASAILVLGLLWIAHQLRLRRLQHEFEMTLEARVGERTRIARDLHDTLLQSFQGLLPRLQAAIYQLPQGAEKSRKTLEEAVDRAAEAITEGRDAVQGLRVSTVEQNDLAQAIETLGQELRLGAAIESPPEFRVVVEGASRNLHPILRDEVYRLAAEALRNGFRHAAAKNVEVEIRYDQSYFRLRVRDDGKGIHSDILGEQGREGHYGLSGMRERSKLVGGKLTIWSELGGGTEIELVIPASRAYLRATKHFWYSWNRSPAHTEEKEPIERE